MDILPECRGLHDFKRGLYPSKSPDNCLLVWSDIGKVSHARCAGGCYLNGDRTQSRREPSLASVLASWISSLRGPPAIQTDPTTVVYTFAAPTAGNTEFASAFNSRFPSSWRYWNSQDVVPHAWESLPDIDGIYDGIGIPAPGDVKVVIDGMETAPLILSEPPSSRTDLERGPVLKRPRLQKKDVAPRFSLRRQVS